MNSIDFYSLLEVSSTIQNTTFLIAGLVVLFILSFSISGSQAAIFSLSDKEIDLLKTKQQSAAKRVVTLLDEPKEVFTSMLIAKTVINICIIVLANYLINLYVPEIYLSSIWAIALKFAVISFVIIFFVEILPRVWASQNSLRYAYEWSFLIAIVEAIHLVLRRFSRWAVSFVDSVGRGVGANRAKENSDQQLDEAIDIQTDDDITLEEKNIMKGIVKFGKISVKKVMRSRLNVSGIDYNTTLDELIKTIEELQYSRLPVYKESLDTIVGVLNTKDLIGDIYKENVDLDWRSKIRQPYFVPESKLIEDLLIDFQKRRTHFAVVVDEFGGTSGIVTLEDVIEEVVGDIKDEFDQEESGIEKVNDNTYVFDGRTMLNDVCKAMQIPSNTFDNVRGDNESIGGLVLELAGELPQEKDVVKTGDFEFTVLEIEKNRVKSIQVKILPRTLE